MVMGFTEEEIKGQDRKEFVVLEIEGELLYYHKEWHSRAIKENRPVSD